MPGDNSSPIRMILRRFAATVRRARRDDRGNAIIEFALVAPAFIALLLAILQTALVFFAQESLESAAEAASRKITTGQVTASNTNLSQFQTMACQGLQAFMSCTNLKVDVQKASSFDQISTTPPTITYDNNGNVNNNWQFTPGGAGDIVIVRLMYIWSATGGPLNFSLGNLSGNQRLLIATNVAKTEPYK